MARRRLRNQTTELRRTYHQDRNQRVDTHPRQLREHGHAAIVRSITDEHDQIGREHVRGLRSLSTGRTLHQDALTTQDFRQGVRQRAASNQ
jgi:hypothetical protein